MKLRILFVLALCVIMLVSGIACKASSSNSSDSSMTGEQIYQNMQDAQLNCSYMHMEGNVVMSGTVTEMWDEESTINVVADITGDYDSENLEMYMSMGMDMDMTTGGHTESQPMNMQMYMVDGWVYEGIDIMGEMSWFKMDFTDTIDTIYEQQRDSVMWNEELMKDAIEVNLVGEETVNGVTCWKLDIQPDWERLFDWAQTEMSDVYGDLPSDVDLGEMFKDVEMTAWVAKDTYYPIRMDMTMTMNIDGEELDCSATMDYSKFNQPVTITLPSEALEAEEMSY
jgi:hypothetical protein